MDKYDIFLANYKTLEKLKTEITDENLINASVILRKFLSDGFIDEINRSYETKIFYSVTEDLEKSYKDILVKPFIGA